MKKRFTFVLVFGLFVFGGLHEAQAQTQIELGPRLGFDLAGDVEEFFVGADGRLGLGSLPVILNATFDIYLVEENLDFWQLSFNALYEFGVDNQSFTPYAGGGIGLSRASLDLGGDFFLGDNASDTDVGLNVIGGATFGFGSLKPFAQAQITFGDVDLLTLGGGLLFRIGG